MNREAIGIVGLGLMGQSIAVACVRAGYRVIVSDADPERCTVFRSSHPDLGEHISLAASLTDFANCTIILEAIIENLDAKLALLAALEVDAPNATIASNTSTFMPSELGVTASQAERLLVCHFFNPADIVPLVELVPGPDTDPARVEAVRKFIIAIGKKPVLLHREIEGFVANRLQAAILRECYSLVERGIASPETIDEVVKLSLAPRWAANGPLATADLGGLDIFFALSNRLFPTLDRSTVAPQTLEQNVSNGTIGAKVGAGVYDWPDAKQAEARHRLTEYFRFSEESQ